MILQALTKCYEKLLEKQLVPKYLMYRSRVFVQVGLRRNFYVITAVIF